MENQMTYNQFQQEVSEIWETEGQSGDQSVKAVLKANGPEILKIRDRESTPSAIAYAWKKYKESN